MVFDQAASSPPAKKGNPRTTDLRMASNEIQHLLNTGGQWRAIPVPCSQAQEYKHADSHETIGGGFDFDVRTGPATSLALLQVVLLFALLK